MRKGSRHRGSGHIAKRTHDEFLELCAVSTSAQLSAENRSGFRNISLFAPNCREALRSTTQNCDSKEALYFVSILLVITHISA